MSASHRFHTYLTGEPDVMTRVCFLCDGIAARDGLRTVPVSYLGNWRVSGIERFVEAAVLVHDGLCPARGGCTCFACTREA
jgi:hypothetical protein